MEDERDFEQMSTWLESIREEDYYNPGTIKELPEEFEVVQYKPGTCTHSPVGMDAVNSLAVR